MNPNMIVQGGANPIRPEWVRIPPEGKHCPYSGLSRRGIINLCVPHRCNGHNPPVRSVLIRTTGRVSGRRMVHLASLLGFMEAQATQQAAKAS